MLKIKHEPILGVLICAIFVTMSIAFVLFVSSFPAQTPTFNDALMAQTANHIAKKQAQKDQLSPEEYFEKLVMDGAN